MITCPVRESLRHRHVTTQAQVLRRVDTMFQEETGEGSSHGDVTYQYDILEFRRIKAKEEKGSSEIRFLQLSMKPIKPKIKKEIEEEQHPSGIYM